MNRQVFEKLIEEFLEECKATLVKKGDEYSKTGDVLENFERTARDYGVTIPQAWGSHFDKHISAIRNYCKTGAWINEPIRHRIKDAVNYLLLLLAHIHEIGQDGVGCIPPGSSVEQYDWQTGGTVKIKNIPMGYFVGDEKVTEIKQGSALSLKTCSNCNIEFAFPTQVDGYQCPNCRTTWAQMDLANDQGN